MSDERIDLRTPEMKIEDCINRIKELEKKVSGIYKSVHGIEPNEPDKIWKEIAELREDIKNLQIEISGRWDQMDELKEKLDGRKESKSPEYFDLGMISSDEAGNLLDYTPSEFVKNYAKDHEVFSLFGLMNPEQMGSGGEKVEAESLRVNPEIPPSVLGKDDNSKPPEPKIAKFKDVIKGMMAEIEPSENEFKYKYKGDIGLSQIIERVRGATRKELIAEFVSDLKDMVFKWIDPNDIDDYIEKWEARSK